jgi:hypothetical protein
MRDEWADKAHEKVKFEVCLVVYVVLLASERCVKLAVQRRRCRDQWQLC